MPTKPFIIEADAHGYGDGVRPERDLPAATTIPPMLTAGDLHTATSPLPDTPASPTRARLAEHVADARHALAHTATMMVDRARSTAATADTYVHERPWHAVGIGAAAGAIAGVVLGFLLARR